MPMIAYKEFLTPDRPERPQNVRSISTTSRSISLAWGEPCDNNAPIVGYQVMYKQPAFVDANTGMQVLNTTTEMVVIPGLHPGVSYTITIVAFNAIGGSPPSNGASVTTLEESKSLLCQCFSLKLLP